MRKTTSELRLLRCEARQARADFRRRFTSLPCKVRRALEPAYLMRNHPRLALGVLLSGGLIGGAIIIRLIGRRECPPSAAPVRPTLFASILRLTGSTLLSMALSGAVQREDGTDDSRGQSNVSAPSAVE